MSASAKALKFLSVATVKGLAFNNIKKDEPPRITLRRSGRVAVQIALSPSHPDDDPFGHRLGLTCKVRKNYSVSKTSIDFVEKLISRIFLPYEGMSITLPHVVARRGEVIDANGKLANGYGLPWKYLPPELKEISKLARDELTKETEKFIKQLAWFFNTSHAHDPVMHVTLYWKTRGRNYHAVRLSHDAASSHWRNDIIWNETNAFGFAPIWRAGYEEPLAHELFREAGSLVYSAPRSSLLILFNALEVGVKSYVSLCAPDTQWLLTETHSPPVAKMLKKFVPNLRPVTKADLSKWNQLNPLLNRFENKLTVWRNHLAHRGATEFDTEELAALRDDVSDILYILDYLSGQSWAINNVRRETCRALGWPDPMPTQTQCRAILSVVDD